MIFRVDKFESCQVTGITDFELTWNAGRGEYSEKLFDIQIAQAVDYIFSMAREAILIRLELFLKKVLPITYRADDAAFLWGKLAELNAKDFKPICQNINFLKDRIYALIPGKKTDIETALHRDAQDIIDFAKTNCEAKFENFINHLIAA